MATSVGFSFDQSFNSDDEDGPQFVPQGRNASIFVIDCSLSMFQDFVEDEDATNLFLKCLTVLERLLLNKIISNNKDLVSNDNDSLLFPLLFCLVRSGRRRLVQH